MASELSALFEDDDDLRAYEEFCADQERGMEPFDLERPALICRWRMAGKHVPLLNRHIRALSRRRVMGEAISRNLVSWAKQHIEWSLAEGDYAERGGVLMLVVDVNGNAAMSVGPYEGLADASRAGLEARARASAAEEAETGVAPEVLCRIEGSDLTVFHAEGTAPAGTLTLVEQLADTRGLTWSRVGLPPMLPEGGTWFLVSDEHGVVPAEGADDPFIELCASGYESLRAKAR